MEYISAGCREGCGACCIAISISSPIPGMPNGKPAGIRCAQLLDNFRCNIFDSPLRPACCKGLQPSIEMCGLNAENATAYLNKLEIDTKP